MRFKLRKRANNGRITTLLMAASAMMLTVCIISFPKQAFEASLQGLSTWWNIVFPALLPFLILSEIWIGFGMMHFLGVLLEPFLRVFFRLPGISGWAISMGAAAGFTAGAQTTARLREQNWITRQDGNRLLAISYLCSPVFIISVVAAGFFQNVYIGWPMVIIHLASWLATGLILNWMLKSDGTDAPSPAPNAESGWFRRAVVAMVAAHKKDGRGFGQLLGDSVTKSVQIMMMVGGFMMLFSVIIKILEVTNVFHLLMSLLTNITGTQTPAVASISALFTGLFEIHLGAHAASTAPLPTVWQIAVANAVLAWGGFSAHAQVKSLVHRTDLSLKLYFIYRIMHSMSAFLMTVWFWDPLIRLFQHAQPSWTLAIQGMSSKQHAASSLWMHWNEALFWAAGSIGLFIIGSMLTRKLLQLWKS